MSPTPRDVVGDLPGLRPRADGHPAPLPGVRHHARGAVQRRPVRATVARAAGPARELPAGSRQPPRHGARAGHLVPHGAQSGGGARPLAGLARIRGRRRGPRRASRRFHDAVGARDIPVTDAGSVAAERRRCWSDSHARSCLGSDAASSGRSAARRHGSTPLSASWPSATRSGRRASSGSSGERRPCGSRASTATRRRFARAIVRPRAWPADRRSRDRTASSRWPRRRTSCRSRSVIRVARAAREADPARRPVPAGCRFRGPHATRGRRSAWTAISGDASCTTCGASRICTPSAVTWSSRVGRRTVPGDHRVGGCRGPRAMCCR